jgi:RNA 2',3'-cyclic 3'-phosphodiesterase
MSTAERPWRCFVAVPIPDDLRAALAEHVARLRRLDGADAAWRWTDPEGWHVTLAFLGATEASAVPGLERSLVTVAASHSPFAIVTGGHGAFPSRGRARVLWYGIADADGQLRRLARETQTAVGLDSESRFRAHLTLARARERDGSDASHLLSISSPPGQIAVDRIVLYRSHLGRGPAHYEELASAPLSGDGP